MISHQPMQHGSEANFNWLEVMPFVFALLMYVFAAIRTNRSFKSWPISRYLFWSLGIFAVAAAVLGAFAESAHSDFRVHMLGHLMLGMLAPLLMTLAAPMTLFMRFLNVRTSRRLAALLKSNPIRLLADPIIASLLNVGGLWVLYTTRLYSFMQQNSFAHLFVHLHVFIAGYLFTLSMISIDPKPYRIGYRYRAGVLVAALAAHSILSKHLFANPPYGVNHLQAEAGAMLMYYGGDAIDIVLIFVFCRQWYRKQTETGVYHVQIRTESPS